MMEVNAKGGGWGGFNRMREVGGLVGRRAVGRLGVSRSSQKKLGVKGGRKKMIKKLSLETKKTKLGKKI
jgi:hypothetical protein